MLIGLLAFSLMLGVGGRETQAQGVGGPVILGGDDFQDHGSASPQGTNFNGWLFLEKAIGNIHSQVTRPGADGTIAALGSSDSDSTSGNAGGAIKSVGVALGKTVNFYDGETAINQFFTDLATGTVNPSVIWMAGTGASNDSDSGDIAAFTTNATAIAGFVASGGGLFSHGNGPGYYSWLGGLLPGLETPSGCSQPLTRTAAGQAQFPGVADSDLQAGPCHSHFAGSFGGLVVLAVDTQDRAAIVGGSQAVLGAAPPASGAPPPAVVTITKEVVGDEAPAGATFTFRLECLGPDFDFSLGAGESFTASISQNTLCSLTETDTQGAESVSGEFSDVLIDGNRTITVTNTFPNFPEVLGTAITKTLVSASPAALGESVRFDIGVTFTGGPLRNVELVDVYEHDVLGFEGVYVGSTRLDCQVFAGVPDSGHSTVACAIGEVTGPFTVQARFDALAGTLPGRSVNQGSVISDQDGAGGDPPTTTGPVSAGVEIVQVLALPPLGDGATHSSSAAATMLFAALAALGLVLGGRRLTRLASSER